MKEQKRVLFVNSEILPYVPETITSTAGRYLPQGIQEAGKEIRSFMPRYGCINERRNQLHEVIRLSGMNIIVNDIDRPLIIKVASIPSARMQVYFIDNDDYFQRKFIFNDAEGYADLAQILCIALKKRRLACAQKAGDDVKICCHFS